MSGSDSLETGNALITVLIMVAALTPLGAFAVMQARLDVLVQDRVQQAARAFAVAESGLEHMLADLRLDPNFDRLMAGPDRIVGNSDDGQFPFRGAAAPLLVDPDFGYAIRVDQRGAASIDLVSTATGRSPATHTLAARVVRDAAFLPGGVTTAAATVTLDMGSTFRVSGNDRASRDPARPGLVLNDGSGAGALAARMPSGATARLQGAGTAPSIAERPLTNVEDVATSFASAASSVGSLINGTIGPGVVRSSASMEIGSASGSGVAIISGNLHVTGSFTYSGIVIVLGNVAFDAGSIVDISGGLLQGRGNGLLAFLGDGQIAYDSRVIQQVDAAFPGRLPHRARVTGWRDLS